MPLDTQMPAWLTEQSKWINDSGQRNVSDFFAGAAAVQNLSETALQIQAKKNDLEVQPAMNLLKLQDLQLKVDDAKSTINEIGQDQQKAAEWQTAKQTDPNAPEPAWQSEKYQMQSWQRARQQDALDVRKADIENRSVSAKIKVQNNAAFVKELETLDPLDPVRAGLLDMTPNKDGTPSAMMVRTLSLAKQAAQVRAENEKLLATQNAVSSGDVATTVVGPKGVTTTYKPGVVSNPDAKPITQDLGDFGMAIWMPGAKTLHVLKRDGKATDYTPHELSTIAKGFNDTGDPRGKVIQDFLGNKAIGQISKPAAPAPTAPKIIIDKSGKKWNYTGSASDPTLDKDPSHWKLQ